MNFEEQIDKSRVYQQQGSNYEVKTYKREPRLRGTGNFFSNFAQRYAYPVFQSFMRFAKPIASDIFSDVKSAAAESIKKSATKKLEEMVSKIGQKGKARKRRKRGGKIKKPVKKRKTSKKRQQKGGRKRKRKNVRRQKGKSRKRRITKKSFNKQIVPGFANDIFK